MESNVTTVAFRSNLYPVNGNGMDDHVFHSKIHDPFALEELQKHTYLTLIQKDEFRWASGHCSYAAEGDYPWGTVKDEAGREHVVCRCLNTQCHRFTVYRIVPEDNEKIVLGYTSKSFTRELEQAIQQIYNSKGPT